MIQMSQIDVIDYLLDKANQAETTLLDWILSSRLNLNFAELEILVFYRIRL